MLGSETVGQLLLYLQAGLSYIKIVWELGKLIFSWRTVADFEEEIGFHLLVEEANCLWKTDCVKIQFC